jgi:nucleotidyltransferase/DNA polymerase involved in DNA repair
MHLVRLDIDKKNTASQFQVGPLGGGLNAVYSPIPAASALLSRFVRNVLFHGQSLTDLEDADFEAVDGSLTWVDASGHLRMISCAGGAPVIPSRYVHSPLHPSDQPIYEDDAARIRGVGNLFWEGDEEDGRWDDIRSDILSMVFCSPLGSVSPEKLWWAASRLGVHAAARTELDEGYERLKNEERELLDRLRHSDAVDHDRSWWVLERDRIHAELSHVAHTNQQRAASRAPSCETLEARLAAIKLELAKERTALQEQSITESDKWADATRRPDRRDDHRISQNFGSLQTPKVRPTDRVDASAERIAIQTRIDRLAADQATIEGQIRQHLAAGSAPVSPWTAPQWDDSQLRQQLTHAEEMIRRWDRRDGAHRRLAEVQSHLRTRSPYRRTSEGSLIPTAEKFLRELTAGAVRQLPAWAIEASYTNAESIYGPSDARVGGFSNQTAERDAWLDKTVPSPNTRQRRLVDLAIRLAIATTASTRIGRIPMILEHSIDGFRDEPLEQLLHVLARVSRDGRQILVTTGDEFVARRIAAHGGSVARVHENLRYAKPHYVIDTDTDLGVHPILDRAPVVSYGAGLQAGIPAADSYRAQEAYPSVSPRTAYPELNEVNRLLDGIATEEQSTAWWSPAIRKQIPAAATSQPLVYTVHGKTYYLSPDSPVEHCPSLGVESARKLRSVGIHRIVDLTHAPLERVAAVLGADPRTVQRILSVVDLMCHTPQMKAFDARVLVCCGINRSSQLAQARSHEIAERVQNFLATDAGRGLMRTATEAEIVRIQNWISHVRSHRASAITATGTTANVDEANETPRSERRLRRRLKRRWTRPEVADGAEDAGRPVAKSTIKKVPVESHWKFYLELASPVVDAPTIGPKMAEKLHAINIKTVGDLVASDESEIADALAEKGVNKDVVAQWQQQAMLVCRIPNLRGTDAQLLVASGCTTAEAVATMNAASLHAAITSVASSKQGQRFLRGGSAPDRQRVEHWIEWAQNSRAVRAA